MATYFITPPESTDWHLDEEAFEQSLRQRWPDVEVRRDPDPQINYPLIWTLRGSGGPVEGSLDRAGQAVTVDGDLDDAARFAIWLRTLVPADEPLIFCDESYSADVLLVADTAAEELASAFTALQ